MMDGVDDSGIDCEASEQSKALTVDVSKDSKDKDNDKNHKMIKEEDIGNDNHQPKVSRSRQQEQDDVVTNWSAKKTVELQAKTEKIWPNLRKLNSNSNNSSNQPKSIFLSRNRLNVPSKSDVSLESDLQPLVVIDMDDSDEDEFVAPRLSRKAQRDATQQLMRDGYNITVEDIEEELDLIPPRPLNERFTCCNVHVGCSIQ